MKNLILFILLITCLMATAHSRQGTVNKGKSFKSILLESTDHLKQNIARDLKQSVGMDEFIVKLQLEVNESKLKELRGIPTKSKNSLQDYELPGLFIDGTDNYSDSSLKDVTKEDILLSLKNVKIELSYYQDQYDQDFLKASLVKLVKFNLPLLRDDQIQITVTKEVAPYKKFLDKKEKEKERGGSFLNFWNDYYVSVSIALIVLALVLATFGYMVFYGGFGKITEAIKNKTVPVSDGNRIQSIPELRPQIPDYHENFGADDFESHVQAQSHLAEIVKREPKLCNEIVILKLLVSDYRSLVILLDVLPKDKRELFLANLDQDKRDAFKDYIVTQGPAVLRDDQQLKAQVIKMIKLIKVASLSPLDLHRIVMVDVASEIKGRDLQILMKAANVKEKHFLSENLSIPELAQLFQQDILSAEDLKDQNLSLNQSEMVDLIMKVGSIGYVARTQGISAKLIDVYAHIETGKGEILAETFGIGPEMRFQNLFIGHQVEALKYLEGLSFNSLVGLFPLLTPIMQEETLKFLPELLSERLKFSNKNITSEGLRLKSDFYFHLRSMALSEKSLIVDPNVLAA